MAGRNAHAGGSAGSARPSVRCRAGRVGTVTRRPSTEGSTSTHPQVWMSPETCHDPRVVGDLQLDPGRPFGDQAAELGVGDGHHEVDGRGDQEGPGPWSGVGVVRRGACGVELEVAPLDLRGGQGDVAELADGQEEGVRVRGHVLEGESQGVCTGAEGEPAPHEPGPHHPQQSLEGCPAPSMDRFPACIASGPATWPPAPPAPPKATGGASGRTGPSEMCRHHPALRACPPPPHRDHRASAICANADTLGTAHSGRLHC